MKHGAELLVHIQADGSLRKSELVRSSGYVTTNTEGKKRLNCTARLAPPAGALLRSSAA